MFIFIPILRENFFAGNSGLQAALRQKLLCALHLPISQESTPSPILSLSWALTPMAPPETLPGHSLIPLSAHSCSPSVFSYRNSHFPQLPPTFSSHREPLDELRCLLNPPRKWEMRCSCCWALFLWQESIPPSFPSLFSAELEVNSLFCHPSDSHCPAGFPGVTSLLVPSSGLSTLPACASSWEAAPPLPWSFQSSPVVSQG